MPVLFSTISQPVEKRSAFPEERHIFPLHWRGERPASSASRGETDSYPNDEDSGPYGGSYTGIVGCYRNGCSQSHSQYTGKAQNQGK